MTAIAAPARTVEGVMPRMLEDLLEGLNQCVVVRDQDWEVFLRDFHELFEGTIEVYETQQGPFAVMNITAEKNSAFVYAVASNDPELRLQRVNRTPETRLIQKGAKP